MKQAQKCKHGLILQTCAYCREFEPEKEDRQMDENKKCKIKDCGKKIVAQGLCISHYDKWRHGQAEMVEAMGGPFKSVRPGGTVKREPAGTKFGPDPGTIKKYDDADRPGYNLKQMTQCNERLAPLNREPATADRLADEHWSYIRFLLLTHGTKEEDLGQVEFHYRSAFVHGYKHGLEAKNEGVG